MEDVKTARAELRKQAKYLRDLIEPDEKKRKSDEVCHLVQAEVLKVLGGKGADSFKRSAIRQETSAEIEVPGGESGEGSEGFDASIGIEFGDSVEERPAGASLRLGVYSAFADEVNLDELILWAYEQGIDVSFPCMMKDAHGLEGCCEQTMEFRSVSKRDFLLTKSTLAGSGSTRKVEQIEGEEGVPFLLHPLKRYFHDSVELSNQPYVSPDELDFLVCPCVAFDGEGNRLGYGAGNYDRYLSQLEHCRVLGVAFSEQCLDSIPVEEHDIPIDFVSA